MGMTSLPSDEDETGGIVAEINITPLTDIFLVLLIIFMVTTTAAHDESKNIQLPTASESEAQSTQVTVSLDDTGKLKVNDYLVPPGELQLMLEEALEQSEDKVVVLRGDKHVLLGEAVDILDTAQKAGASVVAVATQQPGASD